MGLTLREPGHPQPTTPIHCINATEACIANGTVKRQRSRSMEMQYFYIGDIIKHKEIEVNWRHGQENLRDCASKHHDKKHHQQVRPIYLHEANSPPMLPRATKPSVLRGCVGTIPGGYVRGLPQPIYGGITTPATQIRTQVSPET